MHISIPVDQSCEFLEITPVNPLISKCQIKVCYVSDEPNRNGSVITKETARQMANSLPGCPIVGFFNDATGDFEEHNRTITVANGKITVSDSTIPYGFVDMNPRIWFKKFKDDGMVEREYLMTEGYIWTGQYPECNRIITRGNNQSMELDQDTLDATWTKDNNGNPQFFIINEAIISKLCILGEDVEPCFEGSQITKVQFALDTDFQNQFIKMANELKEILDEGGTNSMQFYAVEVGDALWCGFYDYLENTFPRTDDAGIACGSIYGLEGIYEEDGAKFAVIKNKDDGKLYKMNFSLSEANELVVDEGLVEVENAYTELGTQFALENVEAFEAERYAKKPSEEDKKEENMEDEVDDEEKKKEPVDNACGGGGGSGSGSKKKKYNLEEVEEYTELQNSYTELETKFNAMMDELNVLREFKNSVDKKAKEDMIASFYMLSNEDKKDVIDNIDKYSLDDIEAKLSIICVRNKVNFSLDAESNKEEDKQALTFSLEGNNGADDNAPAWIKAVRDNMKK